MRITFDPAKREATLATRGLDFADASEVFGGPTLTVPDLRREYGESRFVTYGLLQGRLVIVVWTPRNGGRQVISMRKANEREQERFGQRLGES